MLATARGGPPVVTMHGPGGLSVAAVHGPGGQVTERTTYGVTSPGNAGERALVDDKDSILKLVCVKVMNNDHMLINKCRSRLDAGLK